MISWIVAFSLTILLFLTTPVFKKSFHLQNNYLVKKFSIIIYTKNAEGNLHTLLTSVKKQIVSPFDIIVVDNHSQDKTKEIAEQFGAKVLTLPPLPHSWQAMNWAYWIGAKDAVGDVLLFVDCNTAFEKNGLLRIAEIYKKQLNRGILTVQPYLIVNHWYETLSMLFNMVRIATSGASTIFSKINGRRGGFEHCFICAKQDYFYLGGHEKVKDLQAANVNLAKLARKSGVVVEAKSGYRAISIRLNTDGFTKLVNALANNFVKDMQTNYVLPFLLSFVWLGSLALFIVESASLMWSSPLIVCGLYASLSLLLFYFARIIGNFQLLDTLLFPVHLVIWVFIFCYSIGKSFGSQTLDEKYVIVQKGEDEKLK